MNKQFKARCLLPFHHLAVRPNNQVYPCCQFKWEHTPKNLTANYPDVFHHPFMESLRQDMINDTPNPGCTDCYKQEEMSNGQHSMRLDYLRELGVTIPEEPIITHLDLALSNLCNNRCRMCNPDLSTNWHHDAAQLGKDWFPDFVSTNTVQDASLFENQDFKNLRFLKMIGGEPLLEEKKFINILLRCDLPKLKIMLTTNCTIFPSPELLSLFSQCKSVNIMLSVDAHGSLNDFLRKGSKWDNVVSIMDRFVHSFPNKVGIFSVISIYNINVFYQLQEFLEQHYGNKVFIEYRMVDGPKWITPANLPEAVKRKILNKLKDQTSDYWFRMIQFELENPGDFNLFKLKDAMLNKLRNEDWKQHNLELHNLLFENN